MKVALVQMDIIWGDIDSNLAHAESFISSVGADLFVLPENFPTGFMVNPDGFAESMDGRVVKWFVRIAKKYNTAVVGSAMIEDNGEFFNRLLFAKPDGEIETYDKRHLFTLAGEDKVFSAGQERIIVDYKGFRIMPLICYDLRFPMWSRGVNEYDLIIYIASWDIKRIGAWDKLLPARAIENQAYCVGVNRVGVYERERYNGHSVAYDYYGSKIAEVPEDSEGVVVVELDRGELDRFRAKFPVWKDADKYKIEK